MDWKAAIPFLYIPVSLLLMNFGIRFPRYLIPLVCLNTLIVQCVLAWILDQIVSLDADGYHDQFSAEVDGLTALGKVVFAAGHEAGSKEALSHLAVKTNPTSTKFQALFLFFSIIAWIAGIVRVYVKVKADKGISGKGIFSIGLGSALSPVPFVLLVVVSPNQYDRALWGIALGFMSVVLPVRGCYHIRQGLRLLLATDELRRGRAAQARADSVLHHVLKNVRVDRFNSIELFLEEGAERAVLSEAQALLFRGMWWCRMREAMLRIVSGSYKPALKEVSLAEFARALGKGRPKVACAGPDTQVLLDPLVCAIVLDNAVSNAIRHGRPGDPGVQLRVVLLEDHSAVQFVVSNRANSGRPKLQRWTSESRPPAPADPPSGQPTPLSDGLGLSHIYAAAKVIGMAVELWQDDDTVFFRATLPAGVVASRGSDRAADAAETVAFPRGLRIACLDDSGIARRSLRTVLGARFPESVVSAFGSTADEVEAFKAALLDEGCDIAVFHQNLDFPGAPMVGTSVLEDVLSRGYDGLACMRSGNVSEEDQQLYFRSGAHCVFDKELPLRDLALQLAREYLHRRPPAACSPPPAEHRWSPGGVGDDDRSDRSLKCSGVTSSPSSSCGQTSLGCRNNASLGALLADKHSSASVSSCDTSSDLAPADLQPTYINLRQTSSQGPPPSSDLQPTYINLRQTSSQGPPLSSDLQPTYINLRQTSSQGPPPSSDLQPTYINLR